MAAGALAALLAATRPADLPGPTVTAVILTVPLSNAMATATLQSAPTPIPGADPADTPPPPPSTALKVGDYVQVTGTGEQGFLNLRAEPGTSSPVNYLAIEREVLQVQAGPAEGFSDYTFFVNEESNDRLPVVAGAQYGADSAIARMATSVEPPGGQGTIKVTGLVGKSAAPTLTAPAANKHAATNFILLIIFVSSL